MATRYVVVALTYSPEVAAKLSAAAKECNALVVEELELEPGDKLMQWSHVMEALEEFKRKTP